MNKVERQRLMKALALRKFWSLVLLSVGAGGTFWSLNLLGGSTGTEPSYPVTVALVVISIGALLAGIVLTFTQSRKRQQALAAFEAESTQTCEYPWNDPSLSYDEYGYADFVVPGGCIVCGGATKRTKVEGTSLPEHDHAGALGIGARVHYRICGSCKPSFRWTWWTLAAGIPTFAAAYRLGNNAPAYLYFVLLLASTIGVALRIAGFAAGVPHPPKIQLTVHGIAIRLPKDVKPEAGSWK